MILLAYMIKVTCHRSLFEQFIWI